MEVRPEYKQTEVGVIPGEWETAAIGEICDVRVGRDLIRERFATVSDQIFRFPVYSNTVTDEGLYGFYSIPEYEVESVTVVGRGVGLGTAFARTGGYGAVGRLLVLLPSPRIDARYLATYINERITIFTETGGIPQLTGIQFSKYRVAVPPTPEQRAIAAALSDVDTLLGGLDRLIAKKRDLKQAAMQQLLTGQTRLPGFHGEWEVKRLGELGPLLKGRGVKKDETRSGDLPCIRYGEIYTHHNDYVRSFNSWIAREVANTATPLRRGDVLFAGSGETKEEIGKCVAFVDETEAYAGGDIVILRPNGANSLFLGYLLNSPAVASQKASRGQGDAVVHISASALASINLSLPTPDEQAAISTVLSDMDTELFALEARRDKTRALKQAMMQDLLTGRTRLVPEGAADA